MSFSLHSKLTLKKQGLWPRIKAFSGLFLVISKQGAEKYFSQTLEWDSLLAKVLLK